MKIEVEIHPAQGDILKNLLFKQKAKFSELNTQSLSTDNFTFHIKRLVELGLVEKNESFYSLTNYGKEFANRFETTTFTIEKQAKISVKLLCLREKDGLTEYLIQKRLKQPYFGFFGMVGGKVRWGETTLEAAARELKEETGLTGDLEFIGLQHKLDYSLENELLEDKFFLVVKATNLTGELIENFTDGQNAWMTFEQVDKEPKFFHGARELIEMTKRNTLSFHEAKYHVQGY